MRERVRVCRVVGTPQEEASFARENGANLFLGAYFGGENGGKNRRVNRFIEKDSIAGVIGPASALLFRSEGMIA